MDKDTRNRIQRATQAARRLLEDELSEQLGGVYDIRSDGTIAADPGAHLREDPDALRVRGKLLTAVGHHRDQGLTPADAVAALQRECAFTTLNRFVALKMLEARGIVQECVSKGPQSSGFREFSGLAAGLTALPDHGYRLYIDSLFDEIGREVRVLFDRRDPASLIWPRKPALDALLGILSDPELAEVWGEDETIGWVYQYFNGEDERRQMRAESQAPRNSRELAVRNQFFTPRYVVEFLTDNTLARTWVEMRQGDTRLVEECRYLVKRKAEVFLAKGEDAPEVDEDVPLEDRTVYVPFRAKKDPRDLKVLDPACGSGHFLLYSFDVLLPIYEEAWADAASPASEVTGRRLAEDYATLQDLRRALPGLILRHNLHGVDIDPRAAQIAALALWMRAQRAWSELSFTRADRPLVTRTNIVVAEPMPGEADLLDELCADLDKGVAGIVRAVFDDMKLAGEAGTLLRIEETVRRGLVKLASRGQMYAAEDADRWRKIESATYLALQAYADKVGEGGFRKRLFAEDASRGFAFVDLCRNRFDTILMNPPFGETSVRMQKELNGLYRFLSNNFICGFLERMAGICVRGGMVGSVVDRTILIKNSFEQFRREVLFDGLPVYASADLGWGVLDANVEVSAIVAGGQSEYATGGSVSAADNRMEALRAVTSSAALLPRQPLVETPFSVINFDLPEYLLRALARWRPIHTGRDGFVNGHTIKSDELKRLVWELAPERYGSAWKWLWNGSEYHPFYTPMREGVVVGERQHRLLAHPTTILRSPALHDLPGLCFGKRGEYLDVQVLPKGFTLTNEGFGGPFGASDETWFLLGYLNSRVVQHALNGYCGQHKGTGYVNALPIPGRAVRGFATVAEASRTTYGIFRKWAEGDEVDPHFISPWGRKPATGIGELHSMVRQGLADLEAAVRLVEASVAAMLCSPDEVAEVTARTADRPETNALRSGRTSIIELAEDAISWGIGCAFGRFRLMHDADSNDEVSDSPFAELPPCSPGMLTGSNHLPITVASPDHTYAFPADGLLVDDSGAERDILVLISEIFAAKFDQHGDDRLNEAREILDPEAPDLRSWLRSKFFELHIKRYSKSRRKAPIYWQLGTPSASYSVWLYIHRTGPDTLHTVLRDHVEPKLRFETNRLATLRSEAGDSPAPSQRKDVEAQEAFVDELRAFRDELKRVAPLWNPDLDDGVVINASFLHRLFAHTRSWQTECEKHWKKLKAGDYDWAHIAMRLWPERVVPKCADDRSLAIAHGLEDVFWFEDDDGKWQLRDVDEATIECLVRERTSPAVKDALKQVAAAPPPPKTKRATRSRAAPRRARAPSPALKATQMPLGLATPAAGPSPATLDSLRAALHQFPDGAGKSDLLEASGVDEGDWKSAIDALVTSGEVERSGRKRGTKYQLAGGAKNT